MNRKLTGWIYAALYIAICYFAYNIFMSIEVTAKDILVNGSAPSDFHEFKVMLCCFVGIHMTCGLIMYTARMPDDTKTVKDGIFVISLWMIPFLATITVDYFIVCLVLKHSALWLILGVLWLLENGITCYNESDKHRNTSLSGLGLSYSIEVYLNSYFIYRNQVVAISDDIKNYLKHAKY